MNVFVLNVQADEADDNDMSFDVELGYTTITQQIGYTEAVSMQEHHEKKTQILPEHNHNKKLLAGKHISVQLFLIVSDFRQPFYTFPVIIHTPAIPPAYRYLYFREINPPPPKSC